MRNVTHTTTTKKQSNYMEFKREIEMKKKKTNYIFNIQYSPKINKRYGTIHSHSTKNEWAQFWELDSFD